MNSIKESNGNDSRTWYQDKKIQIRNTRIPDKAMCPCVQMPSLLLHGADGMQLIVCISSWNPHLVHKRVVRLVSPRDLYIP